MANVLSTTVPGRGRTVPYYSIIQTSDVCVVRQVYWSTVVSLHITSYDTLIHHTSFLRSSDGKHHTIASADHNRLTPTLCAMEQPSF